MAVLEHIEQLTGETQGVLNGAGTARNIDATDEGQVVAPRTCVHFSSVTVEWETPRALFDELSWIYGGFTLDPCATTENAKCPRFFTRAEDGLAQPWDGKVFLNPPYGKEIGRWVKKAYEASLTGALVVCLLPARTDTRWWQDYARRGHICFLRGRLKFGNARNAAPFPSAIVTFRRYFSL